MPSLYAAWSFCFTIHGSQIQTQYAIMLMPVSAPRKTETTELIKGKTCTIDWLRPRGPQIKGACESSPRSATEFLSGRTRNSNLFTVINVVRPYDEPFGRFNKGNLSRGIDQKTQYYAGIIGLSGLYVLEYISAKARRITYAYNVELCISLKHIKTMKRYKKSGVWTT
jgi:hypothetical protein